ncbi:MAG: GrpB family protein [Chloroflexota bacterium]|nr:GrpB family protein [Chloroflexota bacterium]
MPTPASTDVLTIVPYDPRWPAAFAAEAARMRAALGDLAVRVEHNGSTAVPGLAAKPIIDIQVSVAALAPMDSYRVPLQAIGYTHVPHADDACCPFFHRPHDWPHTHHVHVVATGGAEERRTLAFRDYLRDHPETAREYAALKRRLAPRFSAATLASRQAYAGAKTTFVERVVAEALRLGYPRS